MLSPSYCGNSSFKQTLADLAQHNALTFVLRGRVHNSWSFSRHGKMLQVAVKGSMMSDDAEVIHRLAVKGEGITYKSWLDVSELRFKLL